MEQDIRDVIQQRGYAAWCSNPKSFLEMATGTGKTRIAIMAVEAVVNKFPDASILIIVPTELIRDKVFPEDFKKFGKGHFLKNVKIECMQTVYKWNNTHHKLVILDEAHNMLPKDNETDYEYFKFFENNTYDYFLGLSATIGDDLKQFQHKIGPTVFSYDISQAAKDGVVSAFKFVNFAVSFTTSELEEYKKVQRSYNYYEMELGGAFEAYRNAIMWLKDVDKEKAGKAGAFLALVKKRKSILDNAVNKKLMANKIMDAYPKKNGILFSSSIPKATDLVSGRLDSVVYHSKLKKKEKLNVIRRLEDKRTKIRWISSVKALNEGVSINNLEIGIECAGDSKTKNLIQRIGRTCRLIKGKKPVFIRLYVPGTQEEKWMRKSQKGLDQSLVYTCSTLEELKNIIDL